MVPTNETIKNTLKAKLKDIGVDLDDPELDQGDIAERFKKVNITFDDLICAGRVLEGVLTGNGISSNLEITDGAAFALSYLIARIAYRLDASIEGGQFIDRFANSFLKTIHISKSKDKKQRRTAESILGLFVSAVNSAPSTQKRTGHFSSFIEVVEELPTPRKGKKVRVQSEKGRPRGSGGYKQTDRELLLKFKDEHGRLPESHAEFWELAELAGGKDSKDAYDRTSTIRRLRTAATALRKEGF